MPERKVEPLRIDDARLIFRNFAGAAREFNSEGDRNFSVIIEPSLAKKLIDEGWNVKQLKPREEGEEGDYHLKVKLSYGKGRPPRVVLRTSHNQTELGADQVGMVDAADIEIADILINPYVYDVQGRQGISAYLKTAFITIREDALEQKYAEMQKADFDLEAAND